MSVTAAAADPEAEQWDPVREIDQLRDTIEERIPARLDVGPLRATAVLSLPKRRGIHLQLEFTCGHRASFGTRYVGYDDDMTVAAQIWRGFTLCP